MALAVADILQALGSLPDADLCDIARAAVDALGRRHRQSPPTLGDPPVLTAPAAAEVARVTPKQWRGWVRRGIAPPARGGKWSIGDVAQAVAENNRRKESK